MSTSNPALSDLVDQTTVLSLLSTVAIVAAAWLSSLRLLPDTANAKTRFLFIWHAADALCHLLLEGGYLYNVFFSWTTTSLLSGKLPGTAGGVSAYLPPNIHFLGNKDRLYGALYGTNPLSAVWREYAKADARWGGSDLTVVSLEILTVFIGTPMAFWICNSIRLQKPDAWFWMIILATGELYGGFMTFAPEWLSGSPNLNTGNFLHLYVYLTFFNMLWVFIPVYILYEAYKNFVGGHVRFAPTPSPSPKKGGGKKKR